MHKSIKQVALIIMNVLVVFALILGLFNLNLPTVAAQTDEPEAIEPTGVEPVYPVQPVEPGIGDYEVVQNADAYLHSLALGNEEPVSQYGPARNDPDQGIPKHAYSPFDDPEVREVCPPGGCDYVAGRVLIKFAPDQALVKEGTMGFSPLNSTLDSVLNKVGIVSLQPLFPTAQKPALDAMIETVDGALMPEPDLTLWYQAETTSGDGLGSVVEMLQNTAGITYAEPDYIRKPIGEMSEVVRSSSSAAVEAPMALPGSGTDPLYDQQWHLAATHVPEAWAYLESQGLPAGGSRDVVVAVIDTGVDYTHPDLAANIWVNPLEFNGLPDVDDDGNGYMDDIHGADTVSPDGNPMDDHGHGTHVAGIIAAQANNGIGGVGVAFNVQVMPIKAAQYSGVLASSDIAEAIYYAVANGADVINMSFGGYARSTVEEDALAVAFGQAVLVAAAGNDSRVNLPCVGGVDMYPAAYNWVLGVMASTPVPDGFGSFLASFSNCDCSAHDAHEYELMAPGVSIWSTLPASQYAAWSGTSMAAPVVSGIAALSRTKWADKDWYSSRFIMGQIASNTSLDIGGVANALTAISIPPKPELSYLEHWLFDTTDINPINDSDGIVDAGETVDLAIVIRNHWGKAENVTVTLETWADGAVFPDPYVTMVYDTVNYGAVGSFNWDDNGLIYDSERVITGVQYPFRFEVSPDTPNDHVIPFRLTMTAENGYDPLDPNSPYSFSSYFYLIVQKGVQLPQIISTDMTLTKDKLWIIDRPVLIETGVVVNVDPGTQIQFWSSKPSDPYSTIPASYLQVEGNLFINGSLSDSVEIFPSLQFSHLVTQIKKKPGAIVEIRYAKAINPVWGRYVSYNDQMFNVIDHSKFIQSVDFIYDIASDGILREVEPYLDSEIFSNSIIRRVGTRTNNRLHLFSGSGNLYDGCILRADSFELPYARYSLTDNVFLKNYVILSNSFATSNLSFTGTRTYNSTFLKPVAPFFSSGKTYFAIPIFLTPLDVADEFANYLSGYVVSIDDLNENTLVLEYFNTLRSNILPETNCGYFNCVELYTSNLWIGLFDKYANGVFQWRSGETVNYTNWLQNYPVLSPDTGQPSRNVLVKLDSNGSWINASDAYPFSIGAYGSWLLEIPGELSLSQIEIARNEFIHNGNFGQFHNNAILNYWVNPNPNYWMNFSPINPFSQYIGSRNMDFYNTKNYWGTSSFELIDASILDNKDDFNLPKFIYEPILEVPSVEAYPFVVDVILSTESDQDASVVGAEPVTFTVAFNRDMDQTIQPQVSFGPDVPMTDFTVHPIDGGWTDARTWVGTFNINPITGDGYQLIRVAGAVAADDPWLVTGDDAGRFRFEVITSGTEAMNLQATGGEGYVDLMWTQTDFDLLSGFHLYRSTTIDGTYTRINSSIIPPEVRSYRDTNVTPGQQYFYKFTVVKSDMTESDFSNVASATPLDTIPPVLTHTIVTTAEPGLPLTLTVTATDNVSVTGVTLYYRHIGDTPYLSKPMVKTTGSSYYATIEGSLLTSPGIEYYIEASDGISVARSGRAEFPNPVTVVDKPVITIVTPNSGPTVGGTAVTISGSNFKSGATVTFGGAAASNVVVVSANQITCSTPAHIPETVDVRVTNPDMQYGLLLNGFTFVSTAAQISLPTTGGGTGNIVTVPVNAGNLQGLVAASLTVTFDPAVLTARSAATGSLTSGWSLASNLTVPGQVRLSMISPSGGVSGAGTLANIEFEVVGAPGSSTALTLSNVLLNDGAITTELTAGSFSVDNVYNVSGLVSYWNGGGAVPGALMTLSGDKVYSALSGLDGNYTIQGAAIDSYVLTPSKSDGDAGISAYDASMALQHDVGLITLSGGPFVAGDVNSNGAITSMDGYYILQKSVALITLPFPGSGVVWKFQPVDRSISMLTGHLTGQNFTAILLGDISGNWENPLTAQSLNLITEGLISPDAASAVLSIPSVNVLPAGTVDVPITLDITDTGLYGVDLVFTYDPAHVAISNVRVGSLATGWSLVSNLTESGVVRIAMAGANAITTDGQLVLFTVTPLGAPGTQSALTLTRGDLNETGIPSTLNSGSVRISVPVAADFSATPVSGIAPMDVAFTNLSSGDWTTSSWSFGDGTTSSLDNPTHQYTAGGTYTVSLTVSGPGGTDNETKTGYITVCDPVSANFSGTPVSGVAPLGVTFTNLSSGDWSTSSWNFGDGATSTLANPTHTYTTAGVYSVSLTVSGPGGTDTETKTDYITVYETVAANFTGTPASGLIPLTVSFVNTSTGAWETSAWSFGDGATSALKNPVHEYTEPGTYTVSLTVSGLGGTDTETKTSYITVYGPVTADFTGTPTSGLPPLSVSFTNTSVGDWTTSSWDFGDGSTSTLDNPTHQYTLAGAYTVTLSVSGPGGSDSEIKAGYISVYQPVSADFSVTPVSGVAPLGVTFTNLSTGDWTTSTWSFGDGATSTLDNPTHQYTDAGTYTVSLTVSGLGGTDIETKTGYIQVSTLNVGGKVLYWSAGQAVDNTLLTLSGTNTYTDTTDSTGTFAISGVKTGSYVLTPEKTDEVNNITAYDAALVLRHVAELSLLTGYPAMAADMNKSGGISSYDASLILQKAVGLVPEGFTETTQLWYFDPETRSYTDLATNQVNQDFTAVLLGDTTGNWVPDSQLAAQMELPGVEVVPSQLTLEATPPDGSGNVTATVYLDPGGEEVYSLDLTLLYDQTHAEIVSVTKGDIGEGWLLAENAETPGILRFAMADTQPLQEKTAMATIEIHLADIYRTSLIDPGVGAVNEGLLPIEMSGTSIGLGEVSPYSPAPDSKLTASKVTFTWLIDDNAVNYKLKLSTKPDFSVLLLNVKTSGNSYFFDTFLSNNTIYYWRVRPLYADSKGAWSPAMKFTSMEPLMSPILGEPTHKTIFNETETPMFSWLEVENADYYKIQISNTSTFLIKLQQSKQDNLDYQALELNNGAYYWRVRAFDEYGAKSPWSEARKFKIYVQ